MKGRASLSSPGHLRAPMRRSPRLASSLTKRKSVDRKSPSREEQTQHLALPAAAVSGETHAELAAHDADGSRRARGEVLKQEEDATKLPNIADVRFEDENASSMASKSTAVPSSLRGRPTVRGGKDRGERSAVRRRLSWQAEREDGCGGEASEGTSGEERDLLSEEPCCRLPCGSEGVREATAAADDEDGTNVMDVRIAVTKGGREGMVGVALGNEAAEASTRTEARAANRIVEGVESVPASWQEDPVFLGMEYVGCASQYTRDHYERYRLAKQGGYSVV